MVGDKTTTRQDKTRQEKTNVSIEIRRPLASTKEHQKFHEIFPLKSFKVCSEDQPWITKTLKQMDRKRKQDLLKNQKSPQWMYLLNKLFEDKCEEEK